MKKVIFTALLLLSLLLGRVNTVFALDGLILLEETRNDPGGGVIFVFSFTGEFPKSYFTGFVTVGDGRYPIHCNVVDEGRVQCTASRALAGRNVVVHLGEFIFYTFVPEGGFRPSQNATTYCYNVYDVYFIEHEERNAWLPFDVHCQDIPAENGDLLEDFYNPDYMDFYDYEFMDQSPSCFDPVTEEAYYAPGCPA